MNDFDFTSLFEIAEREIEEAERFASEYRLLIDVRRNAGHDTLYDEALLEQFLETLGRTYDYFGAMMQSDKPLLPHRRVLH